MIVKPHKRRCLIISVREGPGMNLPEIEIQLSKLRRRQTTTSPFNERAAPAPDIAGIPREATLSIMARQNNQNF
jgi:hypothetical protein